MVTNILYNETTGHVSMYLVNNIKSINVALWDDILVTPKIRGYKPVEYFMSLKRLLLSDNKSILKSLIRNLRITVFPLHIFLDLESISSINYSYWIEVHGCNNL